MNTKTIGILYNPRVSHALPLAERIAAWVEQRAGQTQTSATNDLPAGLDWQEIGLAVTLGGDGSILHAARAAAPYGTPILGVNLGRVGFLTEAEPTTWQAVLSRILDGDYWIEERMMLQTTAQRDGQELGQAEALNDIVIGRGARAQVVHLHTAVDSGALATYIADGLIIATPTGSTAYALAAGGPILPPQLRNILLVPVAPHLSMERPIVLSEGVTVHITVGGGRPAVLTVDGEVLVELESGDQVTVAAGPHVARFARVQSPTYFYKTLVARLVPRNAADR
ncbi:MAG TPA: NAD(+)/NADH kinase [Chloroflexi bacterium]|nr:NAD(+)/NADH kinase [Chloroflexota bacterium]